MANRYETRRVKISAGKLKGRPLKFIKISDDEYKVCGLFGRSCISIRRRRRFEDVASIWGTLHLWRLPENAEWLAFDLLGDSEMGLLAIGSTAKEAYRNMIKSHSAWIC